MRLYSRIAYDWTVLLTAIAAAAAQIKAKNFTIDGEAVVLGPDGLSRSAGAAIAQYRGRHPIQRTHRPGRPLYVANCLADEQILPSSEENGEPVAALAK